MMTDDFKVEKGLKQGKHWICNKTAVSTSRINYILQISITNRICRLHKYQ